MLIIMMVMEWEIGILISTKIKNLNQMILILMILIQTITKDVLKAKTNKLNQESQSLINRLINYRKSKPLPSKLFRTFIILNKLKNHFRKCWSFEKGNSAKLALFYDRIKICLQLIENLQKYISFNYFRS